jgi:peroxiredoxin (alkyl hydroperoxide reductase subunit C)
MANIHIHQDNDCCCNDDFPIARVGEQAPCFTGAAFINGEIKDISLEDYKGKWVVFFFYPADFTFVCPTELGGIAERYEDLKKMGVEVISCSTDTEWSHKVWADISPVIKTVKYPMLADPSGEVCEAYGVYQENGLAQRGRFIIDPDGVIKSMEITDAPLGRNTDEIIRQLEALIYMRKTPGHACPMSWKPGAKDLKPGIELAGKI